MTANVGDFLRSSLSASSCFLCRGSVLCLVRKEEKVERFFFVVLVTFSYEECEKWF